MTNSVHDKTINSETSVLHGVSAVVFDAVGTLIYPEPSVADAYRCAIQRHCGVDVEPDRVSAVIRDSLIARSTGEDLSTNEQAEHEFWAHLIRELCPDSDGFQACFDDLFAHFARPESWKCFSDVAELVSDLKRAGLKVAIASNFDLRLHSVCDGLPHIADIDCRIISSVVGWRKPAAEFFQAATQELGVSAGQTLMVGDDLINDVQGGITAGMKAAWIRRSPSVTENTALPDGVLQLSTLQQLPELINGSSAARATCEDS
ncbi:MAG TPA: HAD family hydrolase [Planctomycetes bacterium]|nr:HAD family hydrolase [Fuerstiella sp.]HIK93155.1 HAD family hydrolase [Planctomycetota bacterium]